MKLSYKRYMAMKNKTGIVQVVVCMCLFISGGMTALVHYQEKDRNRRNRERLCLLCIVRDPQSSPSACYIFWRRKREDSEKVRW